MDIEMEGHMAPKFYGATTVGERGQVVVPAEARRDFNIKPGDKLVVMGMHKSSGIVITKAEAFTEFLSRTVSSLTRFEKIIKGDVAASEEYGKEA